MDLSVLNNLSYGMYIITTKRGNKKVGCFINTAMQITSKNPMIAISLNKENYTNEILKETRKCAISILNENASQELISKFGYFTSREINKFENVNYQSIEELPVVLEDVCGYIIGEVIRVIDAETHDIFLIRVQQTAKVLETKPMTYRYYHEVLKGMGLKVIDSPYIFAKEGSASSGTGKQKAEILMSFYENKEVKAIFDVSGGDLGNEVLPWENLNRLLS